MDIYRIVIFSIILLFSNSCSNDTDEQNGTALFIPKTADYTGIHFSNILTDTDALNIVEYLYYYNGGGIAVGDINGDGIEDIYFSGNQGGDKLYLNKGNLQFEDITEKAGIIQDYSWSTGVTIDDVNGDGFLDIYVCKVSLLSGSEEVHNRLYINNGDGTFKEMSKEYGLNFRGLSTQAVFFDYDNDGDLDMYLLNHNIHSINSYGSIEKRQLKDPYAGDRMYENRLGEEGSFVDVTESAGIYNSSLGYGLAVAVADINNDGWLDIYVGNDFHENDYIYINNGDKTFTESIAKMMPHSAQFSMGVDIADMNNDGWHDIFITDMMPFDEEVLLVSAGEDTDQIKRIKKDFGFEPQKARNHFQLNQGDGTFSDIAFMTRTFATDWSWSVLMQDFDNDGQADIFITNGIFKRPNDLDYINFLNEFDSKNPEGKSGRSANLIEKMPSQPLKNILFTQNKELTFEKSTMVIPSFSTGAAYADLDNDGDLDIITNNINEKAFIYENTTKNKSWISFDLKGNESYKNTKGTKVYVYAGEHFIYKELQTTRGFMSASTHFVHFGLGNMKSIDSVVVIWPDQYRQVVNNAAINQKNSIVRKNNDEMVKYKDKKPDSGVTVNVLPVLHADNMFYDENVEKLIPERLSYEGPPIIYRDLNGDGMPDIYIGGGRNQPATFLLGSPDGSYSRMRIEDFEKDSKYEDVAAALIDFNGDGFQDLYVVSGGSDNQELDKLLEDRIYLNDGKGVFRRIPISLPHTNGSCVAVGDFDGDGFDDLFIGARSIPGYYGLSPYSFILRNMNGTGVEIMYRERLGMITDAKWVDMDGDKHLDLVVCGDWMDVKILINDRNGGLSDKTEDFGLSGISGLWGTIALADLNNDGILDIVAGNVGTNVKWTASKDKPVKMYVGDFDGNGAPEPLIFYHYMHRYIPFAPMTTLITQLPVLRKKFTSYSSFKDVADIGDLFEDYQNNLVEEKQITELRSMLFLSEGKKFKAIPLGFNEQMADINDIILENNTLLYVGSGREFVSEMSAPHANTGRVLKGFDATSGQYSSSVRWPLPVHVKPKKIISTGDGKYLIATNNGYVYILSFNFEE